VRKRRYQDPDSWLNSPANKKDPNKMRRQNNILLILVLLIMIALIFDIGGIETLIKKSLTGVQ
jgi:hypothetical protein